RDRTVTGVQTCALPIYPRGLRPIHAASGIVHASAMPYASASRMKDEAAARGSSAAASGRRLRNNRASPRTPTTTTSAKIAANIEIGRASCRERGEEMGE